MNKSKIVCKIGDEVFIRNGYRYVSAIVVKIDTSTPITKYYTNLNKEERYFTEDDIKENMVFFKKQK